MYDGHKNVRGWIGVCLAVGFAVGAWVKYGEEKEKDRINREELIRRELDQRNVELANRQKEYSIKYYERRAAVYEELCEVCSRIGTGRKPQDVFADVKRLEQLYHGKLALLADNWVMDEVFSFRSALMKFVSKGDNDELDRSAFRVAAACRDSLRSSFPNVPAITYTPPRISGIGQIPEP